MYRTRCIDKLDDISPAQWDGLLEVDAPPFLRHAYLHALQEQECVGSNTGWAPEYLTLWREEKLVAAAPLYRKTHSYGEYVFDWAWANAYEAHGLAYYPKLVCAIPFTPISSNRLLAVDEAARLALIPALVDHARQSGVSSLHVLFPDTPEATALKQQGLMLRSGVQFHWRNLDFLTFEDYLGALSQPKRKNIKAERRKVAALGVQTRILTNHDATETDWQFFFRCYRANYEAHHSVPYLNEGFFQTLAKKMPDAWVLAIAEKEGHPIASSFALRSKTRLYGRYWGALQYVPFLHFELAYYCLIDWAIRHRIAVFEGGAQGAHKLARGFSPEPTHSAHWISHPQFSNAIQRFLNRESEHMNLYVNEMEKHDAYKQRDTSKQV